MLLPSSYYSVCVWGGGAERDREILKGAEGKNTSKF